MVKWVLRYLKGSKNVGIVYRKTPEPVEANMDCAIPWGFCNANYAEDPHDWKSTSGYVFILMGGPIAWKSKKQASVALSTMEAEYYTLGIVCQEATRLRQLFQELSTSFIEPILIYSDNTSAVALSDNLVFHNRLKQIDIRWHFVQNLI